ncbi:NUDIX domain-containing protein [Undibacter mobilis]|uniref:NUDIX domain-containing protein n=1 Tax=Undibacter mobilis TaxID=2292256 RepID=A0A371BEG6_9BRAD|nr:NUDIX domain-containing protein [Undibacter mobilis]
MEAAGGIVLRKGAGKLVAVVQRSKDDAWVLPRGKLKRDENPAAAARREVVEETGHRVEVHEYLGAITYRAGGRPKVVQFWRMEADPEPSHELMPDIVAVDWLPLKAAIRRLSYPLEKLFLRHAIARALKKQRVKNAKVKTVVAKAKAGKTDNTKTGKVKPAKAGKRSHKRKLKKSAQKKSASKAAARQHPKLKRQAKDARRAGKTKDRAKDRGKRKAKDKKKNKSEGKNRKPKKDRNKAAAPMAPPNTAKTALVAAPPARPAAQPQAVERSPHPRKTILQRVLGRLAG